MRSIGSTVPAKDWSRSGSTWWPDARASEPSAASACVISTTPARRCPPPVSTVRGSVARRRSVVGSRRAVRESPADLGRHRGNTVDAVDAQRIAGSSLWAWTITTSSASADQPASSAETASVDFPAPLAPRSNSARPSRTMAAPWRMKRSWCASNHVSGRYTHRSKEYRAARSGRWMCARSPATVITRPGGAATTIPSGSGQNSIPSISECGGRAGAVAGVASTEIVALGSLRGGSKTSRLARRARSRSSSDACNATRHTGDVDDTGGHEPRRVASR